MVSVKDFKPGQTAYILTRKRSRTQEHFVSQCVVVSVTSLDKGTQPFVVCDG